MIQLSGPISGPPSGHPCWPCRPARGAGLIVLPTGTGKTATVLSIGRTPEARPCSSWSIARNW